MNRPTFLRRSTALLLTLVLMVCAALPGFAAYQMPIQTASDTESVYLFNLDTGKPILRQNSDQQRYIASLTKMMTALLFLESGKDLNAEITIPTSLTQEFKDIQNANGTTMNLRIGETVRRIDLLYGMLVASANDAASVIASDVSGGNLPDFVAQMNARARSWAARHELYLRPRPVRLRQCLHGGGPSQNCRRLLRQRDLYAGGEHHQLSLPATNLHQNERTITAPPTSCWTRSTPITATMSGA